MVQIIEMTYQEKYDMYMKSKKSELIEMLIESNKQLDNIPPRIYFDDEYITPYASYKNVTVSTDGCFTYNFNK